MPVREGYHVLPWIIAAIPVAEAEQPDFELQDLRNSQTIRCLGLG